MLAGSVMKGVTIMLVPFGTNPRLAIVENSLALKVNSMDATTAWAGSGGVYDVDDLRKAQLLDTSLFTMGVVDGVILLVGTETARSDCSSIVSGVVGIVIGMVGSRISMVGIIVFLIRFQGFIKHSFNTHIYRGQGVIKIDGVGFES